MPSSFATLTERSPGTPRAFGSGSPRRARPARWTADNHDLSLEYYTQQGGLFSAGVFAKEIKNFFGNEVRAATAADLEAAGLEPEYVGWNLSTQFNSGDARILGMEFNARHSLRALGKWSSYFTVFANGTRLRREGNKAADFKSFIPASGNWGGSFNRKQLTLTARWNYRGLVRRGLSPNFGEDGYNYDKVRITLDLNFAYQMTRRLALIGSVNNVFDERQTLLLYGSETPAYARLFQDTYFGSTFAIGIRGTY